MYHKVNSQDQHPALELLIESVVTPESRKRRYRQSLKNFKRSGYKYRGSSGSTEMFSKGFDIVYQNTTHNNNVINHIDNHLK